VWTELFTNNISLTIYTTSKQQITAFYQKQIKRISQSAKNTYSSGIIQFLTEKKSGQNIAHSNFILDLTQEK